MNIKRLHVGCGKDIKLFWTNLDVKPPCDIKHDLNVLPYPFKDNHFGEVYAKAVLEHLEDEEKVLMELWRITDDEGIITLVQDWWNHPNSRNIRHKNKAGYSLDYFKSIGSTSLLNYFDVDSVKVFPSFFTESRFMQSEAMQFILKKLGNVFGCIVLRIEYRLIVKKDGW